MPLEFQGKNVLLVDGVYTPLPFPSLHVCWGSAVANDLRFDVLISNGSFVRDTDAASSHLGWRAKAPRLRIIYASVC